MHACMHRPWCGVAVGRSVAISTHIAVRAHQRKTRTGPGRPCACEGGWVWRWGLVADRVDAAGVHVHRVVRSIQRCPRGDRDVHMRAPAPARPLSAAHHMLTGGPPRVPVPPRANVVLYSATGDNMIRPRASSSLSSRRRASPARLLTPRRARVDWTACLRCVAAPCALSGDPLIPSTRGAQRARGLNFQSGCSRKCMRRPRRAGAGESGLPRGWARPARARGRRVGCDWQARRIDALRCRASSRASPAPFVVACIYLHHDVVGTLCVVTARQHDEES
ncbi:hypothetical protein GUJ93_ZPchr0010g10207 [Zizania palustris]|uniref:Uncharacterized protein n=1 Tax=Zizania palustris TaxID=103762 RepID=A0A8J5WF28_ZIZPA|nr:hypothetical protein GUJ93_ZPchr0010g10207 [Zizania palustris]